MPHSNFKDTYHLSGSGVGMCPCGQTFKFKSERDREMKFRLHRKVCPNPVNAKHIGVPKKSMTPKKTA